MNTDLSWPIGLEIPLFLVELLFRKRNFGHTHTQSTLALTQVLGCFVCVYDKNYAIVIVTQQKKRVISNPIGQDKSVLIFHSNIQKYFCLKLRSFGEVNV